MKEYIVDFKETYTYTKIVKIEDDENIDDVIREFEPIYHLKDEEFEKLHADVLNEYTINGGKETK